MCEKSQYLRIHLFLDVMSYHGVHKNFGIFVFYLHRLLATTIQYKFKLPTYI